MVKWTILFRNGRSLMVALHESVNLLQSYAESTANTKGGQRIFMTHGLMLDFSEVVCISGAPLKDGEKAPVPPGRMFEQPISIGLEAAEPSVPRG